MGEGHSRFSRAFTSPVGLTDARGLLEQDQFVAAQVEAGEAAEKAHAKEIDVERALFGDRNTRLAVWNVWFGGGLPATAISRAR